MRRIMRFHTKGPGMTKYICVEWPEYQMFMEHPRFEKDCYHCPDASVYFIPEDLFEEVMYPPYELPDEYKESYTTNFDRIKRGQNLLVFVDETNELKVVKAMSNWKAGESFPILLEEKDLLDGINCEVIAVEKDSI